MYDRSIQALLQENLICYPHNNDQLIIQNIIKVMHEMLCG